MHQKLLITLFSFALLADSQAATGSPVNQETASPSIEVRYSNRAGLPKSQIKTAISTAARQFEKAGVDIAWIDCTASDEGLPQQCETPMSDGTRYLHILSREQGASLKPQPGQLGVSALNASGTLGRFAYIFHHQVSLRAKREIDAAPMGRLDHANRMLPAQLLGHAVAHEVAHLLGLKHTAGGIMHDAWTSNEITDMLYGSLRFTKTEASQLKRQREATLLGEQSR